MGSYNYYKVLGCFNRKFKISETGPPPDVKDAFSIYTQKETQMNADQLVRFLIEYQGEKGCTLNDAENIIQEVVNRRHHLTKYTRHARSLELEDFFYYLFQDDLNGPIKSQVHHDMNAPLQHYFIYTGHNSYLTGNQLSSDCSEIPIIRALERGVRGIELDLWPNSAKDNVHVLHGRTLTTPVPLLTCLRSIRDHAFIKSPYPVIITLEDHLTPELQAKVAEMVIQIFGEILYYPRSECLEEFPSPEELKHRIILSTKPPKEYLESKHHRDIESASPVKKHSVEGDILIKETSEVTMEGHETNDNRSDTDQDDEGGDTSNNQSSQQGGPQYKRLTAMHAGKAKDSVEKDFLVKGTSEIKAEEHEAYERKVVTHDDKDIDPANDRSSQLGAPQYKRLTAMQAGKANYDLKHAQIPEELKNESPLSTKPLKEDVESKNSRDTESASPVRKDSVGKDLLVKETSENKARHEAHEKCDNDQHDLGSDPSNYRSSQQGATQYKRMVAIHAAKANCGLEHVLTPQELKNGTPLSTKPPKNDVESKDSRDTESVSPVRKDSVGKDDLVKETLENKARHEAPERSDTDQDDLGSNPSNCRSSQQGAPQYKRMVAIQAAKANCGLEHAPTPQELTRSTKHAREYIETKNQRDRESASLVAVDSVQEDILVKETSELVEEEHEADERSDSDQDDEDNDTPNNHSSQLGAPQYKRLIAIRAGKAKHGVRHALTDGVIKFNRLSLDEQALEKAATNYGKDLVRFTQRNILRVFPKGTRVTSSNFKPMTGWMHGAQMVAFNMQGYGKSLWIMHGMFRSNGGCGYVKKPDFLMERGPLNEVFDPKVTLPVKKTLRVRVYLGDGWRMDFSHTHFDAFSPPDFYTKLYIIGVPADAAKRKTRIIEDDWGPIWGEEFKFPLTVPELALLRIEVREYDMSDKDDFGGQTCLPVSELRPGIRAVPLYDKKGEKLKSVRLLMQFRFV